MKKNKYIILFIIFYVILSSSNIACASNRIVSLIPSSTELICAVGFGGEIVAVSNYCNYPIELTKSLPKIGDQNLNVEKILSLKPSILIDTNGIHSRYKDIFKKLNLYYVNIDVKTQDDIPKAASRIAFLLGNENNAKAFIENWNNELPKLHSIQNNKKVYVEIWNNPIQAVGGNNNIDSIIKKAGGINVLEKQNDYPIVNSEMIILLNPDIILLAYPETDINSVKNRPGWKNIKAVKNNNIFAINQDTIVRPSPRNLDAIKTINEIINRVNMNEK